MIIYIKYQIWVDIYVNIGLVEDGRRQKLCVLRYDFNDSIYTAKIRTDLQKR